jgi:hypothetical protein
MKRAAEASRTPVRGSLSTVRSNRGALALSIARLGARLVSEAAGAAGASAPRLERTVDRLPRTGVLLASAALFILAAYWLGGRFGRDGGARLYRLGGAALGALNALLVLSVASAAAREAFGPARLRTLLLVPGSARGLDVRIPPLPSAATLSQWSLYAVLVLALLACWWAATTLLPRLRR